MIDIRKVPFENLPVGPYRDKQVVTIGTTDYVNDNGFTCQVATTGDLVYRTLTGTEDLTESSLTAGATIVGPGSVPVILRAIRGSSTVTSVVIGLF